MSHLTSPRSAAKRSIDHRPFSNAAFYILFFISFSLSLSAQEWPTITQTAKPATRWWWLGSAVDKENLEWNIRTYAEAGLGELEITPIYGVQGN